MHSANIIPIAHPTRTTNPSKSWKRNSKRKRQHVPHDWFGSELDTHVDKYAKATPLGVAEWEGQR